MHMRSRANSLRMGMAAALLALPLHAQSSRDSAGILIVENARPSWRDGERLHLAERPYLVIGGTTDSAYHFRQVRGVVRLTDGRVAVANGASLQLRIFDAQGRFLSASGGQGISPGQLLNMHWMWRLRGDTIAIDNGGSAELYSPGGQFVRTIALPRAAAVEGRRYRTPPPGFHLGTMMSNGFGVAMPRMDGPTPRANGTRWIASVPLKIVTPSGDIAGDVGSVPFMEFAQTASGPTPVWLSPTAVIAGGDERFVLGYGDRYEIRVYGNDGKLRSIIRRPWKPEPITAADWEHWVVEWSKLWVSTTGAERERDIQQVREAPWAYQNPAFSQFIVDRNQRLWVRGAHWQDAIAAGSLSDVPAVPSTWSVFDVNGRWLGDVGMPAGFKPFDIGTDYVAGLRWADSLRQVVVYGLIRKP